MMDDKNKANLGFSMAMIIYLPYKMQPLILIKSSYFKAPIIRHALEALGLWLKM